jgi:hypothetical protein
MALGMVLIGQNHPQVGLIFGTLGLLSDNRKHPSGGYAFLALAASSLDALVPDPTLSSIAKGLSFGAVIMGTSAGALEGAEAGWNLIP